MKTSFWLGLILVTAWPVLARAYYDPNYHNTFAYEFAPGQVSGFTNCDDGQVVMTLPFLFPYYGKQFNKISISVNGWAALTDGSIASANGNTLLYGNPELKWQGTSAAPSRVISPLWDDWSLCSGGSIWFGMSGDHAIIEWWNVNPIDGTGGNYSFEIKLFPSGRIEFHYRTVQPGNAYHDRGNSSTIGYQHLQDTVGHPVSFNWPIAVADNTSIAFSRPGGQVFYAAANDFFNPPKPRAGQVYKASFVCFNALFETLTSATNWGGVGRASMGCSSTTVSNHQLVWNANADGASVANRGDGVSLVASEGSTALGQWNFYRQDGFTPHRSFTQAFSPVYGKPVGEVDYWQGGAAVDKPILIVPGFDPLDTDTTARYLAAIARIAPSLLEQGYDIGVGNYGQPDRSLLDTKLEVQQWIADAFWRNTSADKRIQVAGVSQGGVVLRDALIDPIYGSKARAWYSIDAPQKGANMGSAVQGLSTLVACNKNPSDKEWRQLFSTPAKQLLFEYVDAENKATECSCSSIPQNATCTKRTAQHDFYFNGLGWPSVKGYAMAFGNAVAPTAGRLNNGTPLILFDLNNCPDGSWPGTARDCNAGSLSLTPMFLGSGTGLPAPVCNGGNAFLQWSPAFINVDSALAAQSEFTSPTCTGNYTGWADNVYWQGRVWKNSVNGVHSVVPDPAADQLKVWVTDPSNN